MSLITTNFTILRPNGIDESGETGLSPEPTLKQLDAVLNPIFHAQRPLAHYEHVRILSEAGQYVSMFVDAESSLLRMAFNRKATIEYHRNMIVHRNAPHIDGIIQASPIIHGVAVLFDRNVWF